MSTKFIDHLWLWCHNSGVYDGKWKIPGHSIFSPVEAASYMGIKNALMVVFENKPNPPFENCAAQFSRMDKVVWSIIGDARTKRNNSESDLQHVLNLKRNMPNLTGGIMDDFFSSDERTNLDKVKKASESLHTAGLELWVVMYEHLFNFPRIKEYFEYCDVITFWIWHTNKNLPRLEKYLEELRILAPHKKIVLGCYMWDFGDEIPVSIENMQYQCDIARRFWNSGFISDLIILGSPLCGMNIETVEWSRNWIRSL